jgi:hypothetical protein
LLSEYADEGETGRVVAGHICGLGVGVGDQGGGSAFRASRSKPAFAGSLTTADLLQRT